MRLTFHGAARTVTGSCHLIEAGGKRILVDCGMFQGEGDQANRQPFGFDPGQIDAVLLTHAHLDHCGRLPLLVQRGYRGPIFATGATQELARVVLLDSAKIQEEDARQENRYRKRKGQGEVQPLYDTEDAMGALDRFQPAVGYGDTLELGAGLSATFHDAGHILGSAFIELEAEEDGRTKRVVFSGDLGNDDKPIIRDPSPPPQDVDAVIIETTYGNRNHRSVEDSVLELYEVIDETLARGGNVMIPSFALERSQDLMFYLREGLEEGLLPEGLHAFLDSPMAIRATDVFRRHPECYDDETTEMFQEHEDPFGVPGLRMTRDPRDSMEINHIHSGAVILAGAGMLTGGRMLHHLKHNLWREACSLVFVSFAAPGTLARRIIDGASSVRVMGEEIQVGAQVHTINGFSAHAGRDELLAWHRQLGGVEHTFLVHGEPEVMAKFAKSLEAEEHAGEHLHMPELGESFEI